MGRELVHLYDPKRVIVNLKDIKDGEKFHFHEFLNCNHQALKEGSSRCNGERNFVRNEDLHNGGNACLPYWFAKWLWKFGDWKSNLRMGWHFVFGEHSLYSRKPNSMSMEKGQGTSCTSYQVISSKFSKINKKGFSYQVHQNCGSSLW